MAAPKGNQFWRIRSKHGRDKLFANADMLWNAALEYFQWSDENPWVKCEAIKSGEQAGEIIRIPTARPYTIKGLCIYLDVNESYWRDFKKSDNLSEDFSSVITRVEEIIATQKFEGAAVGAFNPTIIARDLGLVDKQGLEHSGGLTVQQITGMEIK